MIDGIHPLDTERLLSCHEEILRLTHLVEDLHTLTSLEWDTITLNKTEFDMVMLLKTVIEQFEPESREKGITLTLRTTNGARVIWADYDRIKQVFINVLSNAVKYTDRGGIVVTVDKNEVTVADTGIGIDAEDLPHIFERLYRSDKSRSRTSGGRGIGLAIAAAIVRAHGGIISAESVSDCGSTFRIQL
jgi:signal transduction histidine kinase